MYVLGSGLRFIKEIFPHSSIFLTRRAEGNGRREEFEERLVCGKVLKGLRLDFGNFLCLVEILRGIEYLKRYIIVEGILRCIYIRIRYLTHYV